MQAIHPNQPIAIIGLGYVGLPLAVEFGKKRSVVGFDINAKRIAELQGGSDHTLETTPEELKAATRLAFTSHADDLRDSAVFIVTVPTPIDDANRPDLTPLVKASETIGKVMRQGAIVIFESTVYPGATEEVCVPVLEKFSGKKFNVDFFCGYSPERINPGDKVNTLTKIKKITSGSTPEVADVVDGLYNEIITAGTHKAASIKVAEAAKVIENTQRDLNIALVNELSVIFERLGIDTLDVLEAAGSKWNFLPFRPGLVGGHCIGVDPYYLTHKAEQVGYHPQVILAGRRINDNMARYVARNTIKLMLKNGMDVPRCRIGVLASPSRKTARTSATARSWTWCASSRRGALPSKSWTHGLTPKRWTVSTAFDLARSTPHIRSMRSSSQWATTSTAARPWPSCGLCAVVSNPCWSTSRACSVRRRRATAASRCSACKPSPVASSST